jgi:hypothetical protein
MKTMFVLILFVLVILGCIKLMGMGTRGFVGGKILTGSSGDDLR